MSFVTERVAFEEHRSLWWFRVPGWLTLLPSLAVAGGGGGTYGFLVWVWGTERRIASTFPA
jgi:nitrate reductase NapE component